VNKYQLMARIKYDTLWNSRGMLLMVFPELASHFKQKVNTGCRRCKKKRLARSILMKMIDLAPGRNLAPLEGKLPKSFLEAIK